MKNFRITKTQPGCERMETERDKKSKKIITLSISNNFCMHTRKSLCCNIYCRDVFKQFHNPSKKFNTPPKTLPLQHPALKIIAP